MLDITAPENVEILIREDRKVVWINIDGVCALRICRMGELVVNDESANREEQVKKKLEALHKAVAPKQECKHRWISTGNTFAESNIALFRCKLCGEFDVKRLI